MRRRRKRSGVTIINGTDETLQVAQNRVERGEFGIKESSLGTTHCKISEERDEPYQDEEARLEEK